jgi:hypothetical protein
MTSITLTKQCDCTAPSSGPRLVESDKWQTEDGSWMFNFRFVEMACDRCDTPWQRDP